ncbi:MAG: sterol desaturase family protein [Saprospiraceae bacterium]|nr:sterol desaturase family protein [Saprospiraceae bacterium]
MSEYWQTFIDGYQGYANYLWNEITHPTVHSYFYWLIAVSIFFLMLEWGKPWRKNQPRFRKDFWLDAFYMFFNFFLFSLIIYNALSDVFVHLFNDLVYNLTQINLSKLNPMYRWPTWAILLTGFLVRDFIQWWVHRLLHRSKWLWEFHKVHHSVEQMGFAAQLRYHWMENVVYRALEYLPLALLGIGLHDFFIIHIFTLAVGHFNHANITVPGWKSAGVVGALIGIVIAWSLLDVQLLSYPSLVLKFAVVGISSISFSLFLGPWMRKVFNNPEMHIWHHAYELPPDRTYGVNFGLSLAIWDYIFGTAYVPKSGRDIRLGFPGIENFPKDFVHQNLHGYFNRKFQKISDHTD